MSTLAAAALAVAAAGPRPVEVVGSGELAAAIRAQLGGGQGRSEELPGTIVETTGEVAGIQAALARVRDLGLVVLAVAPAPGAPDIDLYADLHVRGLTVAGVAQTG